ncbi:hypothetical protein EVAR_18526_1 [Eumeta japonica]|uniref:Uncharacterized protein n=1 Tax=Eumeta variegata TaxID=151549 RepID=A0A4C1V2K0_EUMVA|nr:hypothetical protein EVAR_18526_1 [Eumeta japonica]
MVFERGDSTTKCDILVEGEKVEQVKEFVYLGRLFRNNGKHDRDIERKVNTGNKLNGALLAIMNGKSVSRQARLAILNGVLIPNLIYSSESRVWQKKNESRTNVEKMRSMRSICRVSRIDRCRNSNVRERHGLTENIMIRVERGKEVCCGGLAIWKG